MKIALITETFLPQINGIVRTLEKLIKYLEDNGHEALLITLGNGPEAYSRTKVIRVPGVKLAVYKELHLVKPQESWMANLLKIDAAQIPIGALQSLIPFAHNQVEKALEEFQPDLIHLVTPATLGSTGSYYAEQMRLPCLASFHTDLRSYAPKYKFPKAEVLVNTVTKITYNKADRTLAPSNSAKEYLEEIGVKNVGIFGRGVDNKLFNPVNRETSILENYGLDKDKVTILYAGRLAEEKSLGTLVNSFKEILSDSIFEDKVQLLMVGDGPAKSQLEKSLRGTPHAFTGFKTGEDYAKLHAASDIFGFPSKTETFGQVVLEAMASGLAVVGFDSPGVRDLIRHDREGYLAQPQDKEAFTNYLKHLISDSKLRKDFGQRAFEAANKRSWTQVFEDLLTEYKALLEAKTLA